MQTESQLVVAGAGMGLVGEAIKGGTKEPCGDGRFCVLITVVATRIYTQDKMAQNYARTCKCTYSWGGLSSAGPRLGVDAVLQLRAMFSRGQPG